MGDYDALPRIVFTGLAVAIITLPIWIVPWSIWYVVKGHKEMKADEAKSAKEKADREEAHANHIEQTRQHHRMSLSKGKIRRA